MALGVFAALVREGREGTGDAGGVAVGTVRDFMSEVGF